MFMSSESNARNAYAYICLPHHEQACIVVCLFHYVAMLLLLSHYHNHYELLLHLSLKYPLILGIIWACSWQHSGWSSALEMSACSCNGRLAWPPSWLQSRPTASRSVPPLVGSRVAERGPVCNRTCNFLVEICICGTSCGHRWQVDCTA